MQYCFADLKSMLKDYKLRDGNESRRILRKFVCDTTHEICSSVRFTKDVEKASGMNWRRYVESVDRCVLLQLIYDSLMGKLDERTYLDPLENPSQHCHPKRRGSGYSFGFNKKIPTNDHGIVRQIETALNDSMTSYGKAPPLNTKKTPSIMELCDVICVAEHELKIQSGLLNHEDRLDVTINDAVIHEVCNTIWEGSDYVAPETTESYNQSVIALLRTQTDENGQNVADITYQQKLDGLDEPRKELLSWLRQNYDAYKSSGEISTKQTANVGIEVDQTQLEAINILTKNATQGKYSLTDILNKLDESDKEIKNLKTIKASIKPPLPHGVSHHTGSADDLTYEIVEQKASKVFGKSVKAMQFDIPTLVWKDKSGKEVQHPLCPSIEPNYEFRPQHLVKFLSAHLFGQNIWVHGHTGTGKTTLAEQIASRIGYPVFRLNLDSNMERADIVGAKEIVVENGQPTTRFVEGILPKAMKLPCFLILDEMDGGMPDILFAVQRALEKKGLVLTEDGGRLVESHPYFRFIATANSRGQGDEYGWYQGVRPMNLATLDRFSTFIEVGYLSKDQETKLISKEYPMISNERLGQIVQFTKEIREAFIGGELSTTISPRGVASMCQYFVHMKDLMPDENQAMKSAVDVVITDRCPLDSKQRVTEIAQRCFK